MTTIGGYVAAIGWPGAAIAIFVLIACAAVLSTVYGSKAAVRAEEAKGKNGEQLRRLAADYETLARETRDLQTVMQADLAELRQKVDSIERMMREVA